MKRAFVTILVAAAGVIVGAIGCWYYFHKTISHVVTQGQDIFTSALYNYEIEEANRQYTNPNKDVAIYALNRAASNLEKLPSPQRIGCRRLAYELAKLNVRLAHLYRANGDSASEATHLTSAISHYEKMGWHLNDLNQLKQALPLIESDKTADAMEKFGVLKSPCDQ
jgi:hypothetical protein